MGSRKDRGAVALFSFEGICMSSYDDVLRWCFEKNRDVGMRFGLERIVEASAALSFPERGLRCVHVAGTNGKGSICTKLAKAFELSGYRVGLYTSPHISSFRERIQINGENIPCEVVVRLASVIRERCSEELSFFEATTLIALLWYAEQNVDVAILETGLGGRLDATNICCPDLSIISSISLDHTQYLGNTIEAIAREKAGIVKQGVPVVIGPRVPLGPLQEIAQQKKAPLVQVEGTFVDYDEENTAIARKAIQILSDRWKFVETVDGALHVRPFCRFQEISEGIIEKAYGVSVRVVLDVAHNPDGIAHLLMKARQRFQRDDFVFLLGVSSDKDVLRMASLLQPAAKAVVCTEALSPRALAASKLAQIVRAPCIFQEPELEKAFARAVQIAAAHAAPLLVTGTFFLMHSIRQIVGFNDFYDSLIFNEQKRIYV